MHELLIHDPEITKEDRSESVKRSKSKDQGSKIKDQIFTISMFITSRTSGPTTRPPASVATFH